MRTPKLPNLASSLLTASLVTFVGSLLGACGGGAGNSAPSALVLFVTGITPSHGANQVSPDTHVLLTFSRPLDRASVDAQSVRLGVLGAADVATSVSLVAGSGDRILECSPAAPLAAGTPYATFVGTGLRSTTGDKIGGVRQFSFQTAGPGGGGGIPPASALRPTAGSLQIGRRLHTATPLADGRILVAGGFAAGTTVTDRAETYATTAETFTLLSGRMRAPRTNHAAVRLADGRVLLCGGYREAFPGTLVSTATAELFDPDTNTFTTTGDMGFERVDHAASLLPFLGDVTRIRERAPSRA